MCQPEQTDDPTRFVYRLYIDVLAKRTDTHLYLQYDVRWQLQRNIEEPQGRDLFGIHSFSFLVRCRVIEDQWSHTDLYDCFECSPVSVDWQVWDDEEQKRLSIANHPYVADVNIVEAQYPFPRGDLWPTGSGSITSWLNQQVTEMNKAKWDNTSRDKSIYDAIDDISLANCNWLEMASDMAEPLSAIKALQSLVKIQPGIFGMFKYLANVHLMWKYLVQTNLMDAGEIQKLIGFLKSGRNLRDRLENIGMIGRASNTEVVDDGDTYNAVSYSAKVCYGVDLKTCDGFLDTLNLLRLTPRLTDLWDMVPYSFVVDWIFPLGDAIRNVELNNVQQRLPFKYMVLARRHTRRITRKIQYPTHELGIDIEFSTYERKVLLVFPPDVWFGVRFRDPRKQALTGAALLIQRIDA